MQISIDQLMNGKATRIGKRVLIQAVMPESCSFDNHDEVIGMVYGLDVRKPVAKIYRGALNRACTNLCVFDPEFLQMQPVNPEEALNYKAVEYLLSQTSDIKLMLENLHNTTWKAEDDLVSLNLGKWQRNAMHMVYNVGYGDVKIGTDLVTKAYSSMFEDPDSSYYIGVGNEVDMFTVYNAFTQLISNDKGKDLMNRAEKTLLLRNILNF